MSDHEQLAHALDLPARVREVISAVDGSPKELGQEVVIQMLQSVLNKYDDAKFQVKCISADHQS